jgi:chromosome segregation ATPase
MSTLQCSMNDLKCKINQCAQNANVYKKKISDLEASHKAAQEQMQKMKEGWKKTLNDLTALKSASNKVSTSLSLYKRSRKHKKSTKKSKRSKKSRRNSRR